MWSCLKRVECSLAKYIWNAGRMRPNELLNWFLPGMAGVRFIMWNNLLGYPMLPATSCYLMLCFFRPPDPSEATGTPVPRSTSHPGTRWQSEARGGAVSSDLEAVYGSNGIRGDDEAKGVLRRVRLVDLRKMVRWIGGFYILNYIIQIQNR